MNNKTAERGSGRSAQQGSLSKREREVVDHLAEGLSGAQIAERLVLSPETVRTHIRNAMTKLGASTRSQAVAIALQRGEIGEASPPEAAAPRTRPRGGPARADAVDAALAEVLHGIVSLWDVDAGSIFLAEEDGLVLRRVAYASEGANRAEPPENLALGEGTLGRVALERRSQNVSDATSPGGGGMIVAPMTTNHRLLGVIGLVTRPSRPIGRQELLLLQVFAGRLAELIERGGDQAADRLLSALDRFKVSWAATRSV